VAENITGLNTRVERRDSVENRQRILIAAHKLFEQKGADQVSMTQIAVEAKIGQGTLYRHYTNKGDLCRDLIQDSVIILFEDIENYLKKNRQEQPQQQLKGILSIYMLFIENKAQLLIEGKLPYQAQNPLYNKMRKILVKMFDEMESSVHPAPNIKFRVDMVLISIEAYFLQKVVRVYSPEQILMYLCSTLISPK
jgi:AcrR family transcriptional regulator